MRRNPRKGIKLWEVLLVLVLLVTLVLIFMPRVESDRHWNRTATINNLRQIGLAVLQCNDTYRRLPPASGSYGAIKFHAPLSIHLLPFLESDQLFKEIQKKGALAATDPEAHVAVVAFQAPLDPSAGDGRNTQSFAGNIRVFSNEGWKTPFGSDVTFQNSYGDTAIPRSLPDGTMNTITIATRYAHNSNTLPSTNVSCSPYHAVWDDSPTQGSPFFGRLHALSPAHAGAAGTPTFQLAPKPPDAVCTRASFAHAYTAAGIQVGLGDASVRTIAPSISPETWNRALQPNDGGQLGSDWN